MVGVQRNPAPTSVTPAEPKSHQNMGIGTMPLSHLAESEIMEGVSGGRCVRGTRQ